MINIWLIFTEAIFWAILDFVVMKKWGIKNIKVILNVIIFIIFMSIFILLDYYKNISSIINLIISISNMLPVLIIRYVFDKIIERFKEPLVRVYLFFECVINWIKK